MCALLIWICLLKSAYRNFSKITFYTPGCCQIILKRAQCEANDMLSVFMIYRQYLLCAKQNAKVFFKKNLLLPVYQCLALAVLASCLNPPGVTEIFFMRLLAGLAHDMIFILSTCSVVLSCSEVW